MYVRTCIPVCMYGIPVCMYVYMYTSMYVYVHVYLYVRMCTCIPVCMYVYMYTCMYVCATVHLSKQHPSLGMQYSVILYRSLYTLVNCCIANRVGGIH